MEAKQIMLPVSPGGITVKTEPSEDVQSGESSADCKPTSDIGDQRFIKAADELSKFVIKGATYSPKSPEWKQNKCSYCGKLFKRRDTLNEHIRTHTKEKPFGCQICGARFPTPSTRLKHERTHLGEKRYHCPECGLTFSGKPSLNYHLKVHSGERPFQCPECSKKFIQNSHLRRHLRVHSGEKPFQCSYCDARFVRSSSLQTHVHRHTGQADFKCQHCERHFNNKQTFDYHLRSHSGIRPYVCGQCNKAFIKNSHLNRHVRTMHSVLYDKAVVENQSLDMPKLPAVLLKICTDIKESAGGKAKIDSVLKSQINIKASSSTNSATKDDDILSTSITGSEILETPLPYRSVRQRFSFSCTYCPERFAHMRSLDSHLKFHAAMVMEEPGGACRDVFKRLNYDGEGDDDSSEVDIDGESVPLLCTVKLGIDTDEQ